MVRLASIGSSSISDWFLEAVKRVDGIELTTVYSRSMEKAESFAKKHGAVKWYDSLEQLAADPQVDAVYVASPNFAHKEQAIAMMRAGKHVICEKALGSNAKEVAEMIEAARKAGVIFMEAMRTLYDPGFLAIQNNLDKLGTIRQVDFRFCQYSSRYDAYKAGNKVNIFDPTKSAGALMDIGVYCVEPLIALFSRPNAIKAFSYQLEDNVDGCGTILAQYDTKLATLTYSKITDHKIPSEIQGENGTMVIERISNPRQITIYYRNGKIEEIPIEAPVENNFCYEIGAFVEAISEHKDMKKYHHISRETMEFMDIVRKQLGIRFPADQ